MLQKCITKAVGSRLQYLQNIIFEYKSCLLDIKTAWANNVENFNKIYGKYSWGDNLEGTILKLWTPKVNATKKNHKQIAFTDFNNIWVFHKSNYFLSIYCTRIGVEFQIRLAILHPMAKYWICNTKQTVTRRSVQAMKH